MPEQTVEPDVLGFRGKGPGGLAAMAKRHQNPTPVQFQVADGDRTRPATRADSETEANGATGSVGSAAGQLSILSGAIQPSTFSQFPDITTTNSTFSFFQDI